MPSWECCPCPSIRCPDWVACVPASITYPYIEIFYEYWVLHDGVEVYRKENKMVFRDMKMVFDPVIGCMNSGLVKNPGTWEFDSKIITKTYHQCDYYVDDCPDCKDRTPCTEFTQEGSGNLLPFDVRICCFDPCEPESLDPSHPTNVMFIEMAKACQETDIFSGPTSVQGLQHCNAGCGGVAETLGPYPNNFLYSRRVFGRPDCLVQNTFNNRRIDPYWNYFRDNGSADIFNDWSPSEFLNNIIIHPNGICSGQYDPLYYCNPKTGQTDYYLYACNGGPPPTYCTEFDVETCAVQNCVSDFQCWQDQYGGIGTLLYTCCEEGCPSSACADIVYNHKLTSKFTTATIP